MKKINHKFSDVKSTHLYVVVLVFFVSLAGCDWLTRDLKGQIFIVQQNGNSLKLGLVDVYAISEVDLRKHLLIKSKDAAEAKAKIADRYRISKAKIENIKKSHKEAKENFSLIQREFEKTKLSGEFIKRPDKLLEATAMMQLLEATVIPKLEAEDQATIDAEQKVVNEYENFDSTAFYFSDISGLKALGKSDADGKFSVQTPRGDIVLVATAARKVANSTENFYWAIKLTSVDFKSELFLSNDNLVETKCPSCMSTTSK